MGYVEFGGVRIFRKSSSWQTNVYGPVGSSVAGCAERRAHRGMSVHWIWKGARSTLITLAGSVGSDPGCASTVNERYDPTACAPVNVTEI